MQGSGAKNLFIMVSNSHIRHDPRDFMIIGDKVAATAPDIRVFVVGDDTMSDVLPPQTWKLPTLTVAFNRKSVFVPQRGRMLQNRSVEKLDQMRILRGAGIPVPHCEVYRPGMALDPGAWHEMLLLKPAPLRVSSHGRGIHMVRRNKLATMKIHDFPADHLVHTTPLLVQNYVDTGMFPSVYRALTLCGEVLYLATITLDAMRPDFSESDETIMAGVVATNGGERSYDFSKHPDVVEMAKAVASALPGIPLLGIDVVREKPTGRLYVLEVNAGGNTWHFSNKSWAARRKIYPEVVQQMLTQYGAFNTAAQALVNATRQLAS